MPRLLILSPSVVIFAPSFELLQTGSDIRPQLSSLPMAESPSYMFLGEWLRMMRCAMCLYEKSRWSGKPQQIQRYEARDYPSFAWLREIARLLGLRIRESVGLVQN